MTTPAEWTKQAIQALITEYKNHPLLYNAKLSRKSLVYYGVSDACF